VLASPTRSCAAAVELPVRRYADAHIGRPQSRQESRMRHVTRPFVVQSKRKRRASQAAQPLFSERQLREAQEPASPELYRGLARSAVVQPASPMKPRVLPDLTFSKPTSLPETAENRLDEQLPTAAVPKRRSNGIGRPRKSKDPTTSISLVASAEATMGVQSLSHVETDSTRPVALRVGTRRRRTRRLQFGSPAFGPGERWKRRLPKCLW
jgi:hypothetical protein